MATKPAAVIAGQSAGVLQAREVVALGQRSHTQQHDLTVAVPVKVNAHLRERGLVMHQGMAIDATVIAAPSSTENDDGKHDPEMD